MLCDVVPCGQEAFLVVTIGALCMAGEELAPVRVRMTGITLTRRGNELTHPRIRVDRMALDTRHNGMRASQGIGICVASHIE